MTPRNGQANCVDDKDNRPMKKGNVKLLLPSKLRVKSASPGEHNKDQSQDAPPPKNSPKCFHNLFPVNGSAHPFLLPAFVYSVRPHYPASVPPEITELSPCI